MDSNAIRLSYLSIRALSYHIIEKDVVFYISQKTPESMTLKDLSLLYTLRGMIQKGIQKPKDIARMLSTSKTLLSYRLERLMSGGYLKKTINQNDQREYFVAITEEGERLLVIYMDLINDATQKIQAAFTFSEKIRLLKAIEILASVGALKPFRVNWLKPKSILPTLQVMINDIYARVFNHDMQFLESQGVLMSIKEFRIHLEIYLQSQEGDSNLTALINDLKIPRSTLSRIIEQSPWIIKKEVKSDKRFKTLTLDPKFHPLLEGFMEHRIEFYDDSNHLVKRKNFILVERLMQILKENTVIN
jgi:DNA-binding MarR family transcriptional regulator